jgi:hypothetical protein
VPSLDALGPLPPEKAMRSQHEHNEEQHITGNIAKPAAQARIEVPRSQALQHPDDHRTNDGAHHAVEPADDNDREYFEADQRNPPPPATKVHNTPAITNTNVTAGGGIYSTMSGALWLDHHLNETDPAV